MSAFDPIAIAEQAWNDTFSNPTPQQTAAVEQEWNNFFDQAAIDFGVSSGAQAQANVAAYRDAYNAQTDNSSADNSAVLPSGALQWAVIVGGATLGLLLIYEFTQRERGM